jgi:hypothetical protein
MWVMLDTAMDWRSRMESPDAQPSPPTLSTLPKLEICPVARIISSMRMR